MRDIHVPLKNDLVLIGALGALMNSGPVPRIGVALGPPGTGKTTSFENAKDDCNAVMVRASEIMSISNMLDAICIELGIEPRYRPAVKFRDICEALRNDPRPLFIDEADYLAKTGQMLNVLRDIHDETGVPIILIGMEQVGRKLANNPQFAGRVSQRIEFKPSDLDDAAQLAKGLCEVEVSPGLIKQMHKRAKGSVRLMVVALTHFESFARGYGWERITAKQWDGRPMFLDDKGATDAETATDLEEVANG